MRGLMNRLDLVKKCGDRVVRRVSIKGEPQLALHLLRLGLETRRSPEAIESPRGEAVHWLRTDAGGRVERYHLRSPSYHNWPAVALAAETAIVPDFPLVNKSFELCYACTDR